VPERVQGQPAHAPGGVITQAVGNEGMHELVEAERDHENDQS
jgi:hypothetical protein